MFSNTSSDKSILLPYKTPCFSTKSYVLIIKDQGPGFSETSTNKIFKRFYSNRPKNFGEHSGLGLNIVKNIVELHKGRVAASNRIDSNGAQIEILLPKTQ